MTKLKLGNLALVAACLAIFGSASAQSIRHDFMDARAARADILKLQSDRRMAVRTHNWGKIAQDDRLIAADRHWIRKDAQKVRNGGG